MAFDYFTTTTAELAARPWREWLRTYRAHDRGGHYLRDPGTQDITAQVCIDQLPVTRFRDLAGQTSSCGVGGSTRLVEEGQRAWAAAARGPTSRHCRCAAG